MNLSFAGCGFLGIYHVGVAVCIKKYAPQLFLNKIAGASAGAIAACSLLCDLPVGEVVSDMLILIREARLRTLGPFSPSFNVQEFLLENLRKNLPEDAHLLVNGKLHISLTRVNDGKNVLVSQFDSKEDLLQALLASAFVPIFSGFIPPKFHGERYMDGGFSDNLPILDENTITVSPFCGETDICPRDSSSQLFHLNLANTSIELSKQNIYRFARILWPPKPDVLSNLCKQGFEDTLRFLQINNLINCTKCLAIQSTFEISEMMEDSCEYDPQCQECKLHRQEALVANVPDLVMTVFQEAIDSANKGLYNWLLSHRGMKLITIMSLPYTIPADFMYAMLKKLKSLIPHMNNTLKTMIRFFISQMLSLLDTVSNKACDHLSADVTFQLEYNLGCEKEHFYEKEINLKLDNCEVDQIDKLKLGNVLSSRRDSVSVGNKIDSIEDDTFENILQVTSLHDAVIAFYYTDDNNKVKVTEIFDVTDMPEEPGDDVHTLREKLTSNWVNKNDHSYNFLEEDEQFLSEGDEGGENNNIFSDPESEWTNQQSKCSRGTHHRDFRPESDQEMSSKSDE
ncbi:patatin-like phospholipase domain-containing protein 3 [Cimex lectularius]|uniref:triacylglycerol lipase n=1 Tax=Cimex lectularius TaxID=79782 RepID=A0A8I6R781_CIMLE|nr:patatin-like phospholipase domain-containing protein 3 [Cimex lectularius]